MADLFGSSPTFGGAFSLDECTLSFAGIPGSTDGGLGILIQSCQWQYTRPIQRIYELSPKKTTYYVCGRPEGRMQISKLAAPAPFTSTFLSQFCNVCNVPNNTFSITARSGVKCNTNTTGVNLNNAQDARYKFSYCLIDNVSSNISVGAMALTENVSLIFASYDIDDNGSGSSSR